MKNESKKVKSFIYLDEYKMFSISSQIFEGLTEQIIQHTEDIKTKVKQHKGTIGIGNILGYIIKKEYEASKEFGKQERKILHDYSYNLFEDELINQKKVLIINSHNIYDKIDEIAKCNFIKVKGKALFNDMKIIVQTVKEFNELGKALTYTQAQDKFIELVSKHQNRINNAKGKQKQLLEKIMNNDVEKKLVESAKELGLYQDPMLLDKLRYLLDYGYKDQLNLQVAFNLKGGKKVKFTSVLQRELLKEPEDLLIKKYSRNSEKEFSVFGIITQSEKTSLDFEEEPQKFYNMKEAVMGLVNSLSEIEKQFIGKLPNEIIIDPIAVYREL